MKTPLYRNIVSVSWGDHLIFGEGDGKLDSLPAVRRRMHKWQTDLQAGIIHWRCTRDNIKGHFFQARGYRHAYQSRIQAVQGDVLKEVPEMAHDLGMQVFLNVALFDEGWPLLPKKVRAVSYHNKMHCQHVSWQSNFSRSHTQFTLVDRTLKNYQWGVLCLAYPEVRQHFIQRFRRLLACGNFDALFLCLRSQSRPADFADQFGFNQPVRDEFLKRYARLYLARQWQPRSTAKEKALLEHPCAPGLVFSSFRHDNPGPVRRNDWRA